MAILAPTDISGCVLWLRAKDLTTLFQLITAATAVAADGDVVGTWNDKSGVGNHVTATGNDTTRATYHISAQVPFVTFDGSNDILQRAASLGLYAAGAASVFAAMRAGPGNFVTFCAEGSSGGNNPIYSPIMSDSPSLTTATGIIRNDANTQTFALGTDIQTNAWDSVVNQVYGVVDNGSSLTPWLNGVEGTAVAYTRSGSLTLDRFGLGGLRRAASSSYFGVDVYEFVAYNKALSDTEAADLSAYLDQAFDAGVVFSAAGVSTVAFVGGANADAALSADGVGSATFISSAQKDAALSAAGVGAANFVGGLTFNAVWDPAGISTVQFVSLVAADGAWAAAGVGAASFVGSIEGSGLWNANGVGAAAFVGETIKNIVWASQGVSNVTFVATTTDTAFLMEGQSIANFVGAATGWDNWTPQAPLGNTWTEETAP